jgi:hypothetical protein
LLCFLSPTVATPTEEVDAFFAGSDPGKWTGTLLHSSGQKMFDFTAMWRSGSMFPFVGHPTLRCYEDDFHRENMINIVNCSIKKHRQQPGCFSVSVFAIEPNGAPKEKEAFRAMLKHLAHEWDVRQFHVDGIETSDDEDQCFCFMAFGEGDDIIPDQILEMEAMQFLKRMNEPANIMYCFICRSVPVVGKKVFNNLFISFGF